MALRMKNHFTVAMQGLFIICLVSLGMLCVFSSCYRHSTKNFEYHKNGAIGDVDHLVGYLEQVAIECRKKGANFEPLDALKDYLKARLGEFSVDPYNQYYINTNTTAWYSDRKSAAVLLVKYISRVDSDSRGSRVARYIGLGVDAHKFSIICSTNLTDRDLVLVK